MGVGESVANKPNRTLPAGSLLAPNSTIACAAGMGMLAGRILTPAVCERVSWKSAIVSATDRMAVEKLTFLFHNRCDCRHRAVRCEDLSGEHGNAIALLCCSV